MLEITLEHTILEKIKELDINDRDDIMFLGRINQHQIAVTEEIVELEEKKFQQQSIMDKEWYITFIGSKNSKNSLFMMPNIANKKMFKGLDEYLTSVVNVCLNTKDNILLTNCKKINGINVANMEIIDDNAVCKCNIKNKFSKYTLPISGVNIEAEQESKDLGIWLGRFLKGAEYIVIHDNYIATSDNIKNFQKYMLKYIDKGAEIEIYTAESDKITREDIKSEFEKECYKSWKLSVNMILSKKEHHARMIVTDKYTLNIDKGMTVFGKLGKTHQSILHIFDNRDIERYVFRGKSENLIQT